MKLVGFVLIVLSCVFEGLDVVLGVAYAIMDNSISAGVIAWLFTNIAIAAMFVIGLGLVIFGPDN